VRTVKIFLVAAVLAPLLLLASCSQGGTTHEVLIPRDEWVKKDGDVLKNLPQSKDRNGGVVLEFKKGDTLVVKNEDSVTHTIGLVSVRAGETVKHSFKQTGEFEGACTLLTGDRVLIRVT
jgi:hypothetical protein